VLSQVPRKPHHALLEEAEAFITSVGVRPGVEFVVEHVEERRSSVHITGTLVVREDRGVEDDSPFVTGTGLEELAELYRVSRGRLTAPAVILGVSLLREVGQLDSDEFPLEAEWELDTVH